jgi:hypothetical protein
MRFSLLRRNTGLIRLQSEILLLFSLVPYHHVEIQHVLIVFEVYDAFFLMVLEEKSKHLNIVG